MSHFLERRDRWGYGYGIYVLFAMVFVVPPAVWSLRQMTMAESVDVWLPAGHPDQKAYTWSRKLFPADERVVATWDSSSLSDARLAKFAGRLQGWRDEQGVRRDGLSQVARVEQPEQILRTLMKQEIPFHEAIRRLEGTIVGAGPMKLRLTPEARSRMKRTQHEIVRAAKAKFGIELDVRPPVADLVSMATIPQASESSEEAPAPITPAALAADGTLLSESFEHDLQLSWRGMRLGNELTREVAAWLTDLSSVPVTPGEHPQKLVESCFFVPGSPVAVTIHLSESGLADAAGTLRSIRQAALACGIPADELRLSGSGVLTAETQTEIGKVAWQAGVPWYRPQQLSAYLFAGLLSAGLCYAFLRRVRATVALMAVSVYVPVLAMSLLPATDTPVDLMLVMLPLFLMQVTLAAGLFYIRGWRRAHADLAAPSFTEAYRRAVRPCGILYVSMALGMLCLMLTPLGPVRTFALFGALGIGISAVAVLVGLPALLQLLPASTAAASDADWSPLRHWLARRPGWQLAGLLVPAVAAIWGLQYITPEHQMLRYLPADSRLAQDSWALESHLSGQMPVDAIIRFDERTQQQVSFQDRLELVRGITEKFREQESISGALSLPDFLPVSEPLEPNASILATSRFNRRSNQLQERIRDGELTDAPEFYTYVAEEAEPVAGSFSQPGDELWRISARASLMTPGDQTRLLAELDERVQEVLRFEGGGSHRIVGPLPISLRTKQAMIDIFHRGLVLRAVLLLVTMALFTRSLPHALLAVVPNALAIATVGGLLGWTGQRLDIAASLMAPVTLALGATASWMLIDRYRDATRAEAVRLEAVTTSMSRMTPVAVAGALLFSTGMIALSFMDLLPYRHFGEMGLCLVGGIVFVNLVVLPLALASPLGLMLGRPAETAAATPDAAASVPASEPAADKPEPPRPTFVPRPKHPLLNIHDHRSPETN